MLCQQLKGEERLFIYLVLANGLSSNRKGVASEVGRWGCRRGRCFPAEACPLWTEDVKKQSYLLQGVEKKIGMALCSSTPRTIPKAAVWTTKLIKPGENHSKAVIVWLMEQGIQTSPTLAFGKKGYRQVTEWWYQKEAEQQHSDLGGAGQHCLSHCWVPWWPQTNPVIRCGWGVNVLPESFLFFFFKYIF